MKEIKKIIWATDGSKESQEALKYVVFLAKTFHSEIIGVHVLLKSELLSHKTELQNWMVKVEENMVSMLNSISNELASQGVNFRGVVLKGEVNKEIVRYARRKKADLIAMGKRGHGLIDRMLIGSTTLRVLRESKIPVLAVRQVDGKDHTDIRNILVPLDLYEESDSALKCAINLAEMINANIRVVYVITFSTFYVFTLIPYSTEIPYTLLEDFIKTSSNELANRVEKIKLERATKMEISTEVVQGTTPSVAIVDYANNRDIDLIVINTHGRKGVKKLVLGSVAEKVIQESTCPVLALKP